MRSRADKDKIVQFQNIKAQWFLVFHVSLFSLLSSKKTNLSNGITHIHFKKQKTQWIHFHFIARTKTKYIGYKSQNSKVSVRVCVYKIISPGKAPILCYSACVEVCYTYPRHPAQPWYINKKMIKSRTGKWNNKILHF